MQRHASALKAARQALKRRGRNIAAIGRCRTEMKKLRELVDLKAKPEDFKKQVAHQLNTVQSVLSKAASKKILRPQTASRYISRLSQLAQKSL